MDIQVIIDKLNIILSNNYPKNLESDESDKLFDKEDELKTDSFSEGAKDKLYDVLIKIEASLKNGTKDDPEFKRLIDRFRGMNTTQHRDEVIDAILAY